MKHLDLVDAIYLAQDYKNLEKVTCFIFSESNCAICKQMLPFVTSFENDYFEVVKVNDVDNHPFPMSVYPSAYFYIPNSERKMPIHRAGGGTKEDVQFEIESCIESFVSNKDYEQVRQEKFNSNNR